MRTRRQFLALLVLAAGFQLATHAVTYTWTQTASATNQWSVSTNWLTPNFQPPPGGATSATIIFFADTTTALPNSAAIVSNNDLGTFQLNIFTLNGKGPAGTLTPAVVTIAGNDLNLLNNGATTPVVNLAGVTGTSTLTYLVNNNITLTNNTTFQGSGTATFNFGGVISSAAGILLTKSGSSALTLSGNNTFAALTNSGSGALSLTGNNTLSGSVTNTSTGALTINGTNAFVNLISTGSGTVTLGGNNTLSGNVTQSGTGTMILGGTNSFGTATVNSGVLQFNSLASIGGSGRNVTVPSGTIVAGGYAFDNLFLNRLVENSNSSIVALAANNSNSLDFSASSAGANLPNASLGATGAFTYSGTLTPNGTTYRLGGGGGTLTVSSDLPDGAGNSLVVTNGGLAGTVILIGTKTYTGGTTVNTGVLQLGNGTTGNNGVVSGNIVLANGSGLVVNDFDNQTLSNAISGTGTLTKSGAGVLTLNTAGSYNSYTAITNGTLQLGASAVLPTSTPVIINATGAGVTATLDLNGNNQTTNGPVSLGGTTGTSTPRILTGAGTLTLGNNVFYDPAGAPLGATISGKLDLGSVTRTFIIGDSGTTAADMTISAAITGGANVGLTKTSTGTLVLSGSNSYSGATTVNFGTLQFNAAGSIAGSGRNVTVFSATIPNAYYGTVAAGYAMDNVFLNRLAENSNAFVVALAAASSNALDFNTSAGANLPNASLGATSALTYSGTLTPNGTTYRLGGGGGTLTVSSALAGANSLVLWPTSSVTLSGANTYTGGTTVNAGYSYGGTGTANLGTLKGTQTSGTPFGTGSITLNGGTLQFAPGSNGSWSMTGATVAGTTFAYGPSATLGLTRTGVALNSLTFTVGSGAGTVLTRVGNGTLIIAPTAIINLGAATNFEDFVISGTAPAVTNGMVNPSIVGYVSPTGDFLTYGANGFALASYDLPDTFSGSDNTKKVKIATAALTAVNSAAMYALRTDKSLSLNSNQTLSIGDNTAGNQAGLIINGTTTIGPDTAQTNTKVDFGASEAVIFNGGTATIGSIVAGSGGLTKFGAGRLVLSGVNSYSGNTVVNSGVLSVPADSGLGAVPGSPTSNSITLDNGATLLLNAVFTLNANRGIYLGPGGGLLDGGQPTVAGVISGPGRLTKQAGVNGSILLTGMNTYTGGTAINWNGGFYVTTDAALGAVPVTTSADNLLLTSGTLAAANSFVLDPKRGITANLAGSSGALSSLGTLIYNGLITGPGGMNHGTVVLGNQQSTYTGTTQIQGTVTVSSIKDVGVASPLGQPMTVAAGTITLGGGGIGYLKYVGPGDSTNRKFTSGKGLGLDASGTGTLALTNTDADVLLNYGTSSVQLQGTGIGTIAGGIYLPVVSGTNSVPITKQGTGTWILNGPTTLGLGNSASSVISITGGVLQFNNILALPPWASSIALSAGATAAAGYAGGMDQAFLGKLQTAAAGTAALGTNSSNNLDFSAATGANLVSVSLGASSYGAGSFTFSGTLKPGLTASVPTYRLGGGGGTLTMANALGDVGGTTNVVIGGSSAGAVPGAGTVIFNAAGSYTGTTLINNGTLKSGTTNAIPVASTVTITATGAGISAGIDLNGNSQTLSNVLTLGGSTATSTPTVATGAGTLTLGNNVTYSATNNPLGATISGKLDLGGAARTFTIGDSTSAAGVVIDTTISAIISNGSLTTAGAGTMVLSGNNTYTGNTTLTAGVLQADDGIGLPNGASPGGGSNLTLNSTSANGGVLQTTGTFSRSLGIGQTNVQWTSAGYGGFSAGASKLTVNLGGASAPLTWASTAQFINTGAMVLSSSSAQSEVEFQNPIDLSNGTNRIIQVDDNTATASDYATLSGVINGGGAASVLNKTGNGLLMLTGTTNSFGEARASAGALYAIDGVSLPSATWLDIRGGVFQSNNSNGIFTRPLGISAGQVGWNSTGPGGFAAQGGKFTVNIGGASAPMVWASTVNFLANARTMVLGSVTADNEVDFQNPIDLNSAVRTVQVDDNLFSSGDFGTLSGVISSAVPASGGLTKTGTGLLNLSNTNTYAGQTLVSAGVLQAQDGTGLPTASNLYLNGGVFQSTGSFTRSLATSGSNSVQLASTSGFSGGASKLTVNLGGAGAGVTWGIAPFGVSTLVFGSTTSGAEVEFQNPISLVNSVRTIQVNNNEFTDSDFATISGLISATGTTGGITKTGAGVLRLTANNTYTGVTTVSQCTLLVNGVTSGQGNYAVTAVATTPGVAGGAMLGGTGTIGTTAGYYNGSNWIASKTLTLTGLDNTNYAALVPGDAAGSPSGSIGTLNIIGDVFMNNYSRLVLEIDGSFSDKLNLTGSLFVSNIVNNGTNNLNSLYLYTSGAGLTQPFYTLVDYSSSFYGKFNQVYFNDVLVADPEGIAGNISHYQLLYGGLNNDVLSLVQMDIPEPASLLLLSLGGLLMLRRRRAARY